MAGWIFPKSRKADLASLINGKVTSALEDDEIPDEEPVAKPKRLLKASKASETSVPVPVPNLNSNSNSSLKREIELISNDLLSATARLEKLKRMCT
jgi:hypothetical protein